MSGFVTVFKLTFLELIRKKVLLYTGIMSGIYLTLYGTGLYFVYKTTVGADSMMQLMVNSQMLTMGLYTAGFIVAFLAVFISASSITGSMEQNAFDVILTAPIKRYMVILGRYIGVLCIMLPYTVLLYGSVILLNIILGHGIGVHFSALSVLKALLVVWLIPITLSTLGLRLSTQFAAAPSGIILTLVYFCGVMGGFMENIGGLMPTDTGAVLTKIGIASSLVMPTDALYKMAFSNLMTTSSGLNLSASTMIGNPTTPSAAMLIYTVIYNSIFLAVTIGIFNKRDL